MLKDNLISFERVMFAPDIDKTYSPATVRNHLGDVAHAIGVLHDTTNGGFIAVTNSGTHGVDQMHGRKLPALCSNGTLVRFEEGADFEAHPDLTMDTQELSELMRDIEQRANDLITQSNMGIHATTSADDLSANKSVLKVENKATSFCLVHPSLGDANEDETRKLAIDILEKVYNELNLEQLGFDLVFGKDAIEITPTGFDKWRGFQLIMQHPKFENRITPFIYEDSNPDFLQKAKDAFGSVNSAVGDSLPKPGEVDWIDRHHKTIHDIRSHWYSVADFMSKDRNTHLARQFIAPRL